MENQTQTLKKGILGNQSENPYVDMGIINQDPSISEINHQDAFEAQLKKNQQAIQQNNELPNSYAYEQNGTYCRTGSFDNGFIETDLKIVKQKGVEERCVSFTIINQADTAEVYEENNLVLIKMEMRSEEQFNNFKEFVAGLNWND